MFGIILVIVKKHIKNKILFIKQGEITFYPKKKPRIVQG